MEAEKWLEEIHDVLAVWAALEVVPLDPSEQEKMKDYLLEKARQAMKKPR